MVENDINKVRNEVYLGEKSNYYVDKNDSFGAAAVERSARRAANNTSILKRTRWKDYGFMRGGDSTPGKLYIPKEEE